MPCYFINSFEQNFFSFKQSPGMISNAMLETNQDWCAKQHVHDQVELLFVAEGYGQVVMDQICCPMRKGDLVIINPGVHHYEIFQESVSNESGIRMYSCCIEGFETGHLLPNYLLPIGCYPVFSTGIYEDEFLSIFLQMRHEHDLGDLWYAQILNNFSKEVIILTLRLLHSYHNNISKCNSECSPQAVKEYIEQHYYVNISIESVAKTFNISRHTLFKLFREYFGMSPIQYINRLRIEQSEVLLRQNNLTLQEIAYAVGFNNYSHFFYTFKRIKNNSPGQHRTNINAID